MQVQRVYHNFLALSMYTCILSVFKNCGIYVG